jgi:hypothetical protein
MTGRHGWPTPAQALLLRAALLHGPEALDAWERWKASTDIDRIDRGSHRLLPLVYRMLEREGVADPLLARLKGVYRHTWSRNQLMLHALAGGVRALQEAGLEAMILKGAALSLVYYRDLGARPMDDVDVLVRTGDAERALELLRARGWRPELAIPPARLGALHGVAMRNAAGQSLDLHWHLTPAALAPDADADYWAAAHTTRLGGQQVRLLAPTHQLFHAFAHGVKSNVVPPLRWVADATVVLRQAPGIDWPRLVAAATRDRLVLPVREGLHYLVALVDAPVPAPVLDELDRIPVSRRDRLEHWARVSTDPSATWAAVVKLWFHWLRHVDREGGALTTVTGFGGYLRHRFGAEGRWDLARVMAAKGGRRLRRSIARRR